MPRFCAPTPLAAATSECVDFFGLSGLSAEVSIILYESAFIATIDLLGCKATWERSPDQRRTISWLPGDELSDATRVGDVPVSAGQGSLLEVASKYGVGGIGHTELEVHVELSTSDCGTSRTDVGVHVVSPPADCGEQPSPSSISGSKDQLTSL